MRFPSNMLWNWQETQGYYIVDGLFLTAHSLGAVYGDDAHCRTVCSRVGGCNSISRDADSRYCWLDTACPGGDRQLDRFLAPPAPQPPLPSPSIKAVRRRHGTSPYIAGASSMFAVRCRPLPKWRGCDLNARSTQHRASLACDRFTTLRPWQVPCAVHL